MAHHPSRQAGRSFPPSPSSLGKGLSVPVNRRSVFGGDGGGASVSEGSGAITFGSSQADAVPTGAYKKLIDGFGKKSGGLMVPALNPERAILLHAEAQETS